MGAERLKLILDALLVLVLAHPDRSFIFGFKQGSAANVSVLLKGELDEGFDAQEILCEFLGKVPYDREGGDV